MMTIDEAARRKFESDWREGNSLSIRDYLPEPSKAAYLGTLEELVCIDLEFRWKKTNPQSSSSNQTVSAGLLDIQTRVEDYIREFPELNKEEIIQRLVEQEIYVRVNAGFVVEPSEYQSRFPEVTIDDSLFSESGAQETKIHDSSPLDQRTRHAFPMQFGSYRLIELLGKGGMGSVFRAKHEAMQREVALKIAEIENLGPQARAQMLARFESEGRTAASVSHDHIVPIFDVGLVDERPYIAMQLVDGGDLSKLSKAEPLECKRAAQYIVGVAQALQIAHDQGMLHRDIKPANILLESRTDRAMLTDFGLARFQSTESDMTRTGQLLGTPSFMPPEQIKNSSTIDHRADIYSLGGSLYQLLTGKPPFKAADVHETLRQVASDDALAPRIINAGIDRDLDTICLKCLEKDPSQRYQSAAALVDDLQLYLDGKPILSRPAGALKRLAKWCRRNPRIAAAQGIAAAAAIITVLITSVAWKMTNDAYVKAATSLNAAVTATDAYQETVQDLYVLLRDEPVLSLPGFEQVNRDLLQKTKTRFQSLIATFGEEPELRRDQAFALAAIAELSTELEPDQPETLTAIDAAIAAIRNLNEESRGSASILEAESNMLLALGKLKLSKREYDAALEDFEQCSKLRRSWSEGFPEQLEAQRKLANSVMNQGICRKQQAQRLILNQQPQKAMALLAVVEANFMDAQKIRVEVLRGRETPPVRFRRDFAKAEFNLAMLEITLRDLDAAIERMSSAVDSFGSLANEVMDDSRLWFDYSKARLRLADFYSSRQNLDEESIEFKDISNTVKEALEDLRSLIDLRDSAPAYQLQMLAEYQSGLNALIALDDIDMAQEFVREFAGLVASTQYDLAKSSQQAEGMAELKLLLNYYKHKAFIAHRIAPEADAIHSLDTAIQEFERYPEILSADPVMAAELEFLKVALSDLRSQSTSVN